MSQKSSLFKRPPHWTSKLPGMAHRLPNTLYSWLVESNSLTKRLRGIYGDSFGVKIQFHEWQPAFIDESRLLSLPAARFQLIREVILTNHGQPLILARTILPAQTIKIAHRNLSHLGSRPLGEVIFAYPDLELRQRQFSRVEIPVWSTALQSSVKIEQAIWGRRTIYAIHNQPLLVAEFFLPELLS